MVVVEKENGSLSPSSAREQRSPLLLLLLILETFHVVEDPRREGRPDNVTTRS